MILHQAPSRKWATWARKQIEWSAFVDKLRVPRRTGETMAEYRRMSREDQTNKKDAGGFVAAQLRDGKRSPACVEGRSMITLDVDKAQPDLWTKFQSRFPDLAAVMYSTHSHTPENPKYRLVVAFSRLATVDEYMAAAHWLTAELGVEQFDPTTYETQRLMFWPSCTTDGEYVLLEQAGEPMDPDSVPLEWYDISMWPVTEVMRTQRATLGQKMGNPVEKPGYIGAFNRVYPAEDAISTFLTEQYSPGIEGRYTWTQGTMANGVIIDPDGCVTSFHGTDPAVGTHNPFDLVRIHRFGHLDAESAPDTEIDKLPSHAAMIAFCQADEAVAADQIAERMDDAMEAFSAEPDPQWEAHLLTNAKGVVLNNRRNVMLILRNDPALSGRFVYNTFSRRAEKKEGLPWVKTYDPQWADSDLCGLRLYLERYGVFTDRFVDDCLRLLLEANAYHPVADYLRGLVWDGVPRVDTLLMDYCSAEDSLFARAATRAWLIGAVKRALEPGCMMQYMLVLSGKQNAGKSFFLRELAVKPAWFSDQLPKMDGSKESAELLAGKWIIEAGEMSALHKMGAEQEAIKTYLTATSDYYRVPYSTVAMDFPRSCVFAGTTNTKDIFRDPTGGRRFWPIEVGKITRGLPVDQIWAEAMAAYFMGEEPYLQEDKEALANEEQERYYEEDPREGLVEMFLQRKLPVGYENMSIGDQRMWCADPTSKGEIERTRVCGAEVFQVLFQKPGSDYKTRESREVTTILNRMKGWHRSKVRHYIPNYGKQWLYEIDVCTRVCTDVYPEILS